MKSLTTLSLSIILTTVVASSEPNFRSEHLQSGVKWTFQTGDETLKGRKWLPRTGRPEVVLIAVHGTQTHSGWFGALAEVLTRQGWAVYAPDRRGSGLNLQVTEQRLPQPADIGHWSQWVIDLDGAVGQVKAEQHPGGLNPPIYLLGSSWGAALTTAYLAAAADQGGKGINARHPASISGHILSVPAGLMSKLPNRAKKAEIFLIGGPLQVLGKVIPRLRRSHTSIGLPAESYSSLDEVQRLIGNDDIPLAEIEVPLKGGDQDPRLIHRATYRFFLQSAAMRRSAHQALKKERTGSATSGKVLSLLSEVDDIAENSRLEKELLPQGSVVVAPGTDHAVQIVQPEIMASVILQWHQQK